MKDMLLVVQRYNNLQQLTLHAQLEQTQSC